MNTSLGERATHHPAGEIASVVRIENFWSAESLHRIAERQKRQQSRWGSTPTARCQNPSSTGIPNHGHEQLFAPLPSWQRANRVAGNRCRTLEVEVCASISDLGRPLQMFLID